jgi:hypothetical protein
MNLYKFECVVYVRGETAKDAEEHLHEEVQYHFGLDNNLVALESGKAELVDETTQEDLTNENK